MEGETGEQKAKIVELERPAWLPDPLGPCSLLAASTLYVPDKSLREEAADGVATAMGCAAIALVWPVDRDWPARPRPMAWRPGVDMVEWGGEIYEQLVRAGLPHIEVVSAGIHASRHVWGQLPRPKAALQSAVGFSGSEGAG